MVGRPFDHPLGLYDQLKNESASRFIIITWFARIGGRAVIRPA